MIQRPQSTLPELYREDETAWLEAMAELLGEGAFAELDYVSLREYLTDMAKRDRREVESRLVVLIVHILKWVHQPSRRTRSWKRSIIVQRQELRRCIGRGVLRNHAITELPKVYPDAVERAAIETGMPPNSFPAACAYSLDELLAFDPTVDENQ